MKDPIEIESQLESPGAGLPKIELWIARWMFRRACRNLDREKASRLIATEQALILKLVRSRSPEECARRVLIDRLRGLEDSSRYWSVYMTLDHLRIVNEAIAPGIVALSAGLVPDGEASTATVKPRPDIGEEVVPEFTRSCEKLAEAQKGMQTTTARYAHPWFGPLDTHGWHVMAGFHMRLHRGQVETILGGLGT